MSQVIDRLKNIPVIVWGLVAISFVIRIITVNYGLPLHLHIDEPALVSGVLKLNDNLNIGRFDWPHLYFYINFIFYVPAYFIAQLSQGSFIGQSENIYFLTSRLLSMLFGVLTIPVVYAIAARAFNNKRVGIISSAIVAFLPVHVFESFFAKLDIGLTFFVSIVVLFILKTYKNPTLKNFLITGFIAGLSISIKYNAFLIYLPFLIVYYYLFPQINSFVKNAHKMILAGLMSLVGFILGTPYAILDFANFWSYEPRVGILWQFENTGSVPAELYASSVYETFIQMFRADMGIILWLIFLSFTFLYLFFRYRTPMLNILFLPVILISLYVSRMERSPSHYFLMLIPLYVPVVAYSIDYVYKKISSKFNLRARYLWVVLLLILLPSIYVSVNHAIYYARKDTRLMGYEWFKQNIAPNQYQVYMAGDDIDTLVLQDKRSDRIKRVDPDYINEDLPVLLVLGYHGVTYQKLLSENFTPSEIRGSSENVLTGADLLFYAENNNRAGPPLMIFRINQLTRE